MSRFRLAAAALLLSLSSTTMAAPAGLPLPIPTLPGLALGQLGIPALPGIPTLGLALPSIGNLGLGIPLGLGTIPGLPALSLPGLPAVGDSGALSLPPLPIAPPDTLVLLLGNLTVAMSPYANQLPLAGLVKMGDPMLRPIITPLTNYSYIPVIGAAFGTN